VTKNSSNRKLKRANTQNHNPKVQKSVMSYSASQLTVPSGFPELLQGLAREVLRNQPGDIVAFAHEHFAKLMQNRQGSAEALDRAQMIEKETTVLTPNADAIVPEKKEKTVEEELPELKNFDNKDVNAITKIQSGFRGMQARKQVKELKEQNETKFVEVEQIEKVENPDRAENPEELPELKSFDDREVNAITKIQSGFRGMQARKQVEGMKAQTNEESTKVQATPETAPPAEEELPNLNEFNNEEVSAITKIQSGFRGMQARKQVQEMKTNTEKTVIVEEAEELPNLEEFDDKEVNAITKIQSGFRGMKARKEVNEMKKSESQEVSSPVTSGPDELLLDTARPMTAQTNAEHVEIPDSARTITDQ